MSASPPAALGSPRPRPVLLARPPRGKVLALAPHPDDEVLGAGGTLALHRLQGDAVTVLYLTSGIQGDPDRYLDPGSLESLREGEARRAAACLGIEDLRFLRFPDNLSDRDVHVLSGEPGADPGRTWSTWIGHLAHHLARLVDAEGFDLVYHPWAEELHRDHWTAARAVTRLRGERPDVGARVSFLGYEVWTACPAETLIDVSAAIPRKVAAVASYASQALYRDHTAIVLGLNRHRALAFGSRAGYAEAFTGRPCAPRGPLS